jgi:hypothetical protein
LVASEVFDAREGRLKLHSHHEAYALIWQALEEYWESITMEKYEGEFPREQMLQELVLTAAMCQRAAEDLILGQEP